MNIIITINRYIIYEVNIMLDKSITIDKVDIRELSVEEFERSYLFLNKPVILTNIFEGSVPLARWTPEYLIEKIDNNRIIKINTSPTNTFFLDPQNGGFLTYPVNMKFKDYIEKIRNPKNTQILYMQQISILRELQELRPDMVLPKYINSSKQHIDDIGLWVSPGGNISPLHYDLDNNFFIQSYGTKKFLIYNPWEFYNLYPNSLFSRTPHISKVNLDNLDIKKYPNFTKTSPIEIIINAGEMFFLPAYWWHHVYSLDLTVSVNVWYPPLKRQCLVPGALHFFIHTWYHIIKDFM